MIRRILTLARIDILVWWRSPVALIAALAPPLALAVTLLALTISVGAQPIALVVEDSGTAAQRVAETIRGDTEAYRLTETDATTAAHLLDTQQVAAVIVIPAGFGAAIPSGSARVELTLNNVDIDVADDIRRAVDRSVAELQAPGFGFSQIGDPTAEATPNVYRIILLERDLRQTSVSFLSYQLVPVIILIVLNVGLVGTALLCSRDRVRGVRDVLLTTPLRTGEMVVGRLAGGTAWTLLVLVPVLAVSIDLGLIRPPQGHWPALLALLALVSISASGLGVLLGQVVRDASTVALSALVAATAMFFLGGGFTTVAFLPAWLQTASLALPTRYAIDGFRQALFYPDLTGVAADLLALSMSALALCCAAALVLRRDP